MDVCLATPEPLQMNSTIKGWGGVQIYQPNWLIWTQIPQREWNLITSWIKTGCSRDDIHSLLWCLSALIHKPRCRWEVGTVLDRMWSFWGEVWEHPAVSRLKPQLQTKPPAELPTGTNIKVGEAAKSAWRKKKEGGQLKTGRSSSERPLTEGNKMLN